MSKLDNYSGIAIKATFPGTVKPKYIQELSGGQQAVIALSLLFAIQRTDPAPFYLFDEIDYSIDDKYRMAVARLILKQSKDAQFIVITHRPEIVEHAHKWYGVSTTHGNISSINPISKEDALAIVKSNPDAMATDVNHSDKDNLSSPPRTSSDMIEGIQEGSQSFVPPELESQQTNEDVDDDV